MYCQALGPGGPKLQLSLGDAADGRWHLQRGPLPPTRRLTQARKLADPLSSVSSAPHAGRVRRSDATCISLLPVQQLQLPCHLRSFLPVICCGFTLLLLKCRAQSAAGGPVTEPDLRGVRTARGLPPATPRHGSSRAPRSLCQYPLALAVTSCFQAPTVPEVLSAGLSPTCMCRK